ncbi:MAG: hypothetical protein J1E36_00470 [Eubacterium sp.]|nr:hypothetical protein [Eubacterium sp.]
MWKKHRINNRVISLFLAMVMLLTTIGATNTFGVTADAAEEKLIVRDDALHFIIRHWHTDYDVEAALSNEDTQLDGNDYFVITEGYIMPNHNETDPDNQFDIYLVNQDDGELLRIVNTTQSPYLAGYSKSEGSVTLNVKPLRDQYDGNDLEKFCGVSLSAGRNAIEVQEDGDGNTTAIKITYSQDGTPTHLVKAHMFYSSWNKTVYGTSDRTVFDPGNKYFAEEDTAEIYVYKDSAADHTAGEIVKYISADGEKACETLEDLDKAGVREEDVELVKFYSTNEGMHTNKSLVQIDGRTFLLDLEAWYIDGHAPQISYILDASGSMAFTSDTPTKVNIYEVIANKIGITQETECNNRGCDDDCDEKNCKGDDCEDEDCLNAYYKYIYVSKDNKVFESNDSKREELKDFLMRLADDEGLLDEFITIISDEICDKFPEEHEKCGEFTKSEWDYLFGKIGAVQKEQQSDDYVRTAYPQLNKLIGYYTFTPRTSKKRAGTHTLSGTGISEVTDIKTFDDGYFTVIGPINANLNLGGGMRKTASGENWSETDDINGKTGHFDQNTGRYIYRSISFEIVNASPENPSIVTIYASQPTRWLQLLKEDPETGAVDNRVWVDHPGGNASTPVRAEITEPGTYYLGSANSGIQIYSLTVEDGKEEIIYEGNPMANSAPEQEDGTATLVDQSDFSNDSFAFTGTGDNIQNLNVTDKGLEISKSNASGVLLDAKPTSNTFTVSFTVNSEGVNQTGGFADILYVGPQSGNVSSSAYYRAYRREQGSSARFSGGSGYNFSTSNNHPSPRAATTLTNINNVFNGSTNSHLITLVFEEDRVISYMDGVVAINNSNNATNPKAPNDGTRSADNPSPNGGVQFNTEDINIILDGIVDVYSGNNGKIYIDDVFVYDTALSGEDVEQLVASHNQNKPIDTVTVGVNWNKIFIKNNTALRVLLNPYSTAHTPLGVAAYNYFVYDGNINTREYAPLAYWEGTVYAGNTNMATAGNNIIGSRANTGTGDSAAGWYYMTHGSVANLGTAKRLMPTAIASNTPDNNIGYDNADRPGTIKNTTSDGTGEKYVNSSHSQIPFYLDEDGNLRCFFSAGTDSGIQCSYVYELADAQYVKTEALQRVLANFSTRLSEQAPTSKISAVKFSSDVSNADLSKEDNELSKLVLLDWTDDAEEIAGIMSQKRGEGSNMDKGITDPKNPQSTLGTADGYDYSPTDDTFKQYNYVLTGGTYAASGFTAYNEILKDRINDPDAPKFVIFFTDGSDNSIQTTGTPRSLDHTFTDEEGNTYYINHCDPDDTTSTYYSNGKHDPICEAQELKDEGYTIISVYLPCGPAVDENNEIDKNNSEYQKAKAFLTTVAGTSEEDDNGEDYFFASNDLSLIEKHFQNYILARIVDKMEGYTIQDYIDPRFDLLNADGTLWQLQAGGQVNRIHADGTSDIIDVTKNNPVTEKPYVFHLSGDTTPEARTPYLKYDVGKDMYYLEWLDQTIPSTPIDSTSLLPVWNAEVILRAKDDFIGGNAILTNGNEKKMNWLFHPADVSPEAYDAYEKEMRQKFSDEFDRLKDSQKNIYVGEYEVDLELSTTKWNQLSPEDQARVKQRYIDDQIEVTMKVSDSYISSGTDDMYKQYNQRMVNGDQVINYNDPIDEYPSKGFPRVTANVQLLPINTTNLNDVIYMGEVISPRQLLTQIENQYITDTYYLEYLKRYAYQRYDKAKTSTAKSEMDMPLLELLTDWLKIDNQEVYEKEFSVPYMYLPKVKYDNKTGRVELNTDGTAAVIYNNTGTELNEQDVVGILTFRWEQLNPDPKDYGFDQPIKDFVKNDTEHVMYSLTVEFTPLRVGDTLEILNGAAVGEAAVTTPEGAIIAAQVDENGDETPGRLRNGIFAGYIPIVGDKTEFTEDFGYDREHYVNDVLINEKQTVKKSDGSTETTDVYQWNRDYKPACPEDQQLIYPDGTPEGGVPDDGTSGDYGDATFLNNGRTLTAFSDYTIDVVSGDIILEMKVLIGELEEATKALGKGGDFVTEFTADATRSFTDTDIAEKIKEQKKKVNEPWEDYCDKFAFTFEFDYTKEQIEDMRAAIENNDPDADPDGYVSIYAKATEIKAYFGVEKQNLDDDDLVPISELPIGTYEFSLDDVTLVDLGELLHFSTIDYEDNINRFKDATEYFNPLVLRGLNITNEYPEIKWREIEVDGKKEVLSVPEISKENIEDFIADATKDTEDKTVTFYLGTSSTDSDAHRGNVDSNPQDMNRYTNDRVEIIRLTTGNTLLTVREDGAQSNESFIYHITGKTLGDKDVDIFVSVKGSDPNGTTIELPPGEYTVTEVSDWSWKYYNKDTYGKDDEEWTLYPNDLKKADTTLWYYDDDPIDEHKTVIYEHDRNDKVWLGSEYYRNNHFSGTATSEE